MINSIAVLIKFILIFLIDTILRSSQAEKKSLVPPSLLKLTPFVLFDDLILLLCGLKNISTGVITGEYGDKNITLRFSFFILSHLFLDQLYGAYYKE